MARRSRRRPGNGAASPASAAAADLAQQVCARKVAHATKFLAEQARQMMLAEGVRNPATLQVYRCPASVGAPHYHVGNMSVRDQLWASRGDPGPRPPEGATDHPATGRTAEGQQVWRFG